jgi:hypothetical protein
MKPELDMATPLFSRGQVEAMFKGFRLLDHGPAEMPREWNIHIGPGSTAKLTFHGPIGADEWDSLLAHIAFYKQWYKDKPTTPLLNLSDAVGEIVERLKPPAA